MQLSISKLTKKYQATIPEPVRNSLDLDAGDEIVFDIEGGKVNIRKALPLDLKFAHALSDTLNEWNSDEDEEAYRDL